MRAISIYVVHVVHDHKYDKYGLYPMTLLPDTLSTLYKVDLGTRIPPEGQLLRSTPNLGTETPWVQGDLGLK